ncbi:uncharacterized protein LOC123310417 [Coccinella septempunctata]|uniref:uncharacterized protein LOC123310417 n=1 Tax=Coccinella septempunctata TaxID=41139 RepID=UPI001D08C8D4|nr:uncharacterized protein LOC123310417 [Coccinella septempunctata]
MHAKCSTVLILFSVILTANSVFSESGSRKNGQKVVTVGESVYGQSGNNDSDFLPTADYAVTSFNVTDEGPTSSSTRGFLIEDTSTFEPNGRAVVSSGSKHSSDAGANASTGNATLGEDRIPRDESFDEISNQGKEPENSNNTENLDKIYPTYAEMDKMLLTQQNSTSNPMKINTVIPLKDSHDSSNYETIMQTENSKVKEVNRSYSLEMNEKKEDESNISTTTFKEDILENIFTENETTFSERTTYSIGKNQEIGDNKRSSSTIVPNEDIFNNRFTVNENGTNIVQESEVFSSTIRSVTNPNEVEKNIEDIMSTPLAHENILKDGFSKSENGPKKAADFVNDTDVLINGTEFSSTTSSKSTTELNYEKEDNEYESTTSPTLLDEKISKNVYSESENGETKKDVPENDTDFSSTTESETIINLTNEKKDTEDENTTIPTLLDENILENRYIESKKGVMKNYIPVSDTLFSPTTKSESSIYLNNKNNTTSTTLPDEKIFENGFSESEDKAIKTTSGVPDNNSFLRSTAIDETATNSKDVKEDTEDYNIVSTTLPVGNILKNEFSESENSDTIYSSTTTSESDSDLNVKKKVNIGDEGINSTTIAEDDISESEFTETETTEIETNESTESSISNSSGSDTMDNVNVTDTALTGSNFLNDKLKISTSTVDTTGSDVTNGFSESTVDTTNNPYSTGNMQGADSSQDVGTTSQLAQYSKEEVKTVDYETTLHYPSSTTSEMTVGFSLLTGNQTTSSPNFIETTKFASTSSDYQTTATPLETGKTNSMSSEVPTTVTIATLITTASGEIPYFCKGTRIIGFETEAEKTTIKINWKLESTRIDDRCQLRINVSCNSINNNFEWIITHQTSLTHVNDSEPVSYLSNLSEYTNYSCTGQLFTDVEDQPVLSTEIFNVTTKKEVPSSVHVDIRNITDRDFYLEWKRPKKIPGNLQMYYILIKRKSIHYIREECSTGSIEMTIPFSSDKEDVSYHFPWAEPNHLYEVQILGQDEAGNSKGITQRGVTESSPSTEPLNVTTTLHNYSNHCKDANYNTTLQLNWELPCNTNGELVEFEINITEIIYLGSTFEYSGNSRVYRVPKNLNIQDVNYQLTVENLNASCAYEVSIVAVTRNDLHGITAHHTSQRTVDGCPSEPSEIRFYVNDSSFSLEWKEPVDYYGPIMDYNVLITGSGPKHVLSTDPTCPTYPSVRLREKTNNTYFTYTDAQPNFFYDCEIEARTSAGTGNTSGINEVVTLSKESEPIRNLKITKVDELISYDKYEYSVRISFQEPCNTNGPFRFYRVEETGARPGYEDVYEVMNVTGISFERILRKPDYHYEYAISVVTEMFVSSTVRGNLTTNAAIPMVNDDKIRCIVDQESPTILTVELKKGMFDDRNGEIIRYAIFLFKGVFENVTLSEPSFGICGETCPLVNKTSYPYIKADHIYRVIDNNWNPFSDGKDEVIITIGEKDHCSDQEFCLALSEDTDYIVLVRGITKNTYRDFFVSIKTGISPSSASLIFISFILLLVAILLLGVYFYSRRQRFFTIRFRSIPNTVIEETSNLRYVVSVKNFVSYYNKIESDPSLLRKQYEELDEEIKKYKEENVHTTFALKPENKRKNRYTNILPYDEYRVKLNIDEDDEISSDYINASYIKGASGEIEYIATQGPLEHTCKDFWKMVIQENVTVIVMVSQFVEKEKEKCYKYFPKNHENMKICEDLEVKCLTELQFDTYCVRTLLIKKDIKQFSVIHMQYLDWPDFGCPTGTYNMISFCGEVRDRIQIERGLMAVHCSAGVGRTGTLISLDILLQTMRREKEISVFECVMDLRKQRTHMVQTEKQYVYIHTCLKDVLENCSLYSFDHTKKNEEHIYENIWKNKVKGDNSEEKESAF